MKDVLILLGSESDLTITEKGLDELRTLGVNFSLRIASAHRTPEHLHSIIDEFIVEGGSVFICVAGMSAHLAGVVASITTKPVLAVPVFSAATAGFDALLSMSQMPKGIPVGTMGFGNSGFINACLLASQIISLHRPELGVKMQQMRVSMKEQLMIVDEKKRIDFEN